MKTMLLLSIALLLVVACGSNSSTMSVADSTTNISDNISVNNCTFNLSLCPEPAPCPAQKPCPACNNASKSSTLVELGLDSIKLSTRVRGDDTDVSVLKLSQKEIDTLKSAKLLLAPVCSNPGRLIIELAGKELFIDTPLCNQTTGVDVDPDYLSLRNTFTFTTKGDEDYDMKLSLQLSFLNGSNETRTLYGVRFLPSETEQELFKKLDTVSIKNYEERTIDLSAEDAKRDFTLTFDGEEREGTLSVLVNDNKVFSGVPKRHSNDITIPREFLKEGENYITFVGS